MRIGKLYKLHRRTTWFLRFGLRYTYIANLNISHVSLFGPDSSRYCSFGLGAEKTFRGAREIFYCITS